MFRVIVIDKDIKKNFTEDFNELQDAIEYAEGCNFLKMNFVVIQDEYENEILRFEN